MEVRDRRRGAEALVREIEDGEVGCFVRHPDAGGKCERTATMRVYGIPHCELHGPEAGAGALEELYQDAKDFLELFDAPWFAAINPEVLKLVQGGIGWGSTTPGVDASLRVDEEELFVRAYLLIPETVDAHTQEFTCDPGYNTPYDDFRHARHMVHKLMRLVFEDGQDWLVEVLEQEREMASAQATFALLDMRRRFGPEPGDPERR